MSDAPALEALLARVEAATGAEGAKEIFREMLFPAFRINQHWRDGDYVCDLWDGGAQLDAAIVLCERVLPGWEWQVNNAGGAHVRNRETMALFDGDAATSALALLAATIRAEIAHRKETP